MNVVAQTRGRSPRTSAATRITAGFIGLLALILLSGSGAAAFESETAPAYSAICHGEGLLDPANHAALGEAVGSVASYCASGARLAGEPDVAEPEWPPSYPTRCHGEGLIVPVYPLTVEECAPGDRPTHQEDADPPYPNGEVVIDEMNGY